MNSTYLSLGKDEKRFLSASQAMAGILKNDRLYLKIVNESHDKKDPVAAVAEQAARCADELLAALDRTKVVTPVVPTETPSSGREIHGLF